MICRAFAIASVAWVLAAGGSRVSSQPKSMATGVWGGTGIELTVTPSGARISYDCASGKVDEPIVTDHSGAFLARGTHSFGQGGPRGPGRPTPKAHAARYEGKVADDTMQLTVSLPDLGRAVGTFTLKLGQRAQLDRCG